ncbi:MAG: alpha/beta hydrolase [Verrucomicrobia bacterium]|nr:alpha/beta hydrolase [Verrucomicrobiota bacterium]
MNTDEEARAAGLLQGFLVPPKRSRLLRAEAELLQTAMRGQLSLRPGTENPEEDVQWYRWGQRGKRVLLVHGWGGRATQFAAVIPLLLGAGYQVVGYDAPGHGASTGTFSSGPASARAARYVAESVGHEIYAVVAHSLGATAAAIALDRGLPVDRAAMLAPLVFILPSLHSFAEHHGASESVRAALLRQFEARYPEEAISPCRLAVRFRAHGLILHDPNDPEVPVAHGRAFAAAWPNCRFEAQPAVGHWRILRAREVVERVLAFLE